MQESGRFVQGNSRNSPGPYPRRYLVLSAATLIVLALSFGASAVLFAITHARSTNGQLAEQTLFSVEQVTDDIADIVLLESRAVLSTPEAAPDSTLHSDLVVARLSQRLFATLSTRDIAVRDALVVPIALLDRYDVPSERALSPGVVAGLVTESLYRPGAPQWVSDSHGVYLSRAVVSVQSLRPEAVVVVLFAHDALLHRSIAAAHNVLLRVSWHDRAIAQVGRSPRLSIAATAAYGPSTGWRVERRVGLGAVTPAVRLPLLLSVMAWGLSVALLVLVGRQHARSVTANITALMRQIESIENGDLGTTVTLPAANEIATVADGFNRMSRRLATVLDELVAERSRVLIERQAATEARLVALTLQISPHFLFNILDVINSMAVMKQELEISTIIARLGRVLRQLVEVSHTRVTLCDELSFAKDITALYGLTIGRSIELRVHVTPVVSEMQVPWLLLQPLIENAVVHGFREGPAEPVIDVRADTTSHHVEIAVRNNGAALHNGDEEAEWAEPAEGDTTVGLLNIARRVRLEYGPDASVVLANEDGWVTVRVRLPYVQRNG